MPHCAPLCPCLFDSVILCYSFDLLGAYQVTDDLDPFDLASLLLINHIEISEQST